MERQTDDGVIYLDNAATSFPKPPEVLQKMVQDYALYGVSPGRGSYDLAVCAADLVWEARKKVAAFFHAPDPARVIFTANATDALNKALLGLLAPGDHVVSTRLEHNSVLRPLFLLREKMGITFDLAPFDGCGLVDPAAIVKLLRPETKLVILNHASNVLGSVQPVDAIGRVCRERDIVLLVDTAQSAGHIPVDMEKLNLQAVAFTGHKGLMGPAGIGGLVLAPGLEVRPTFSGGTGMESLSLQQPSAYPHRLESGTLNLPGIFGLAAGLDYLAKVRENLGEDNHEMKLARLLYDGLQDIPGVKIVSPRPSGCSVPIVTCTVREMVSSDVGDILDGDFQIAVRTGLHCAPLVHETLGTVRTGAVRFSPGLFNTEEDIRQVVTAMEKIAGGT
ncbi:MAG TPA: aminotransferase class V-fold PLP-dependent enzyme [Firmicutes bacterium]|nr:aminotransferase class V-fold PLP-dependent enzyme [Bacillota bacterium]